MCGRRSSRPGVGCWRGVRPDDLAARVVAALVERTGVDPAAIEDVDPRLRLPRGRAGHEPRPDRRRARRPAARRSRGSTVNRFCGSSMQAVHTAAGAIAMGAGDAYVCAGVESMSRVPMGGFNPLPEPRSGRAPPRGLHEHGRDGRERRRALRRDAAPSRRRSPLRQPAQGRRGACAAGGSPDEIVPVGRTSTRGRLPPPGDHARRPGRRSSRRSSATARSPPAPPRR